MKPAINTQSETDSTLSGQLVVDRDLQTLVSEVARSVRDEEESMGDDFELLARTLLCAIEAKERYLIPSIATANPDGARDLRANYESIRRMLTSFSIEFDLGVVRAERFDVFASKLQIHELASQAIVSASGVVQNARALNTLLVSHCA